MKLRNQAHMPEWPCTPLRALTESASHFSEKEFPPAEEWGWIGLVRLEYIFVPTPQFQLREALTNSRKLRIDNSSKHFFLG